MLPFLTQPAVAPACYVPSYVIPRSLVFNGAQILSRPIATTGNRQTFAFRTLVTRDRPGTSQTLYNTRNGTRAPCTRISILADDTLELLHTDGGATDRYSVQSTAVFRSPGVYDVLAVVDTMAAEVDRLRLYVNGVRLAALQQVVMPGPGWSGYANLAGGTDLLGVEYGSSYVNYANDRRADTVWLDGFAPEPSHFGTMNIHGVWVPKKPAFTLAQYGPNGYWLDYSDPLDPGKDASGKGNHFTAVGFNATGKDTVASSPTNVHAALNPLLPAYGPKSARANLTDGNLKQSGRYRAASSMRIVIPVYAECIVSATTATGYPFVGVWSNWQVDCTWPGEAVNSGGSWSIFNASLRLDGGTVANVFPPAQAGDVVGIAVDPSGGNVWMRLNGGAWVGGGSPEDGTVPTFTLGGGKALWFGGATDDNTSLSWNFGQRPWAAVAPSGFGSLCTANLPEPDIKDPAEGFVQASASGADIEAVLDAATAHWSGKWVEIVKRRDQSENWRVRFSDDPTNGWATNTADAKGTAAVLAAGGSYVGYRLRVGKRYGVWTGEVAHTAGAATTVIHGLGTARNVVIATRVSTGGGDRHVRHPDMAAGSLAKLNSNGAAAADTTLDAFGANGFQIAVTALSGTYRVLVLAQRDGYLDLGMYQGTGVGGDGGPFLTTTTQPEWLLCKSGAPSTGWMVLDAARNPSNPVTSLLAVNMTDTPSSFGGYQTDFVAGGVKVRADNTLQSMNASGALIYTIAIGRSVGGVCVAPASAR